MTSVAWFMVTYLIQQHEWFETCILHRWLLTDCQKIIQLCLGDYIFILFFSDGNWSQNSFHSQQNRSLCGPDWIIFHCFHKESIQLNLTYLKHYSQAAFYVLVFLLGNGNLVLSLFLFVLFNKMLLTSLESSDHIIHTYSRKCVLANAIFPCLISCFEMH